jgi:hypothetical protein
MKPKVAKQLKLVETWKDVPEGTPVIVTKDLGEEFHTKTRSGPWMLGANSRDPSDRTYDPGHTAVIMVEGISGGYSLERVCKA